MPSSLELCDGLGYESPLDRPSSMLATPVIDHPHIDPSPITWPLPPIPPSSSAPGETNLQTSPAVGLIPSLPSKGECRLHPRPSAQLRVHVTSATAQQPALGHPEGDRQPATRDRSTSIGRLNMGDRPRSSSPGAMRGGMARARMMGCIPRADAGVHRIAPLVI